MLLLLRSAAVAAVCAFVAPAQVAIPPHSTIYNGFSRGFNFTAGRSFVIVQLELPLDAMQAGDTAGFLVRVNGTQVLHSIGNPGPTLPTAIPITTGDVVDVIGNWSPAAPANFTAHNSYGNSAPYPTVIEGMAHTLNRTGWQWDIGDPAFAQGTYLPATSGSIGRVLMYTSSGTGGTVATRTTYGQGCYDSAGTYYELFTPNAFDLAGSSILMQPIGTGYIVLPGSNTFFTPTSPNLGLTDDSVSAPQTLPVPLVTPAGTTNQIWISSNGFVWTAASTNNGCCAGDPLALRQLPERFAPFWQDLNPGAGGSVHFDVDTATATAYVTWLNVPEFGQTGSSNTVQMAILPGGSVEYRWQTGAMNRTHDLLVGYSPGNNALPVGPVDLSTALPVITGPDRAALALDASARPVLGTSFNLVTSNIPTGTMVGGTILSFTQFAPGVSLATAGMPGCFQHVGVDVPLVFVVAGATAQTPIAMPSNPAFAGVHFFAQAATFSTGLNALGVITSNGVDLGAGTL